MICCCTSKNLQEYGHLLYKQDLTRAWSFVAQSSILQEYGHLLYKQDLTTAWSFVVGIKILQDLTRVWSIVVGSKILQEHGHLSLEARCPNSMVICRWKQDLTRAWSFVVGSKLLQEYGPLLFHQGLTRVQTFLPVLDNGLPQPSQSRLFMDGIIPYRIIVCVQPQDLTVIQEDAHKPERYGGGDGSVVRAPDSWLKGRGFESLLERRENFLLQGRLSVLTLISVSVPPPCYRSST